MGKIYGGLLILDNWKQTKFGLRPALGKVRIVIIDTDSYYHKAGPCHKVDLSVVCGLSVVCLWFVVCGY